MPSSAGTAVEDMPPRPLAYTVRETANLLHISTRQIYNLIADGTLPVIILGGRRLIPARALDRLVAEADPDGETDTDAP